MSALLTYFKRRRAARLARIRAAQLLRYSMTSFRGTKANDWWLK